MPRLTAQQEAFAREYVRCGSAVRAYKAAYRVKPESLPDSAYEIASRLRNHVKIASRIDELIERAARKALVTRETMLVEMAQNREFAIGLDNPSAAQSASRDRAKVAGLLKDDVTIGGDIHLHFDAADMALL